MFIHRGLVFGAIGVALSAGVITSAFAGPEATPTAAESCYSACPSISMLTLSRDVVFFGDEERLTFHVTVRPGHLATGTPTGTAAVVARGKTLCTVTLHHGRGSCSLTAEELKLGQYKVRAVYSGDSRFRLSNSKSSVFEVRRAFHRHRHHFPFGFDGSNDGIPGTAVRAW
jgi:Bacterial Ig-like domain (group 3)